MKKEPLWIPSDNNIAKQKYKNIALNYKEYYEKI